MRIFKRKIKKILDSYKMKTINDYLICLPVHDETSELIAFLRPVTANYMKTIPKCVELMSKWRVENPTISTGTFVVTHERTKKWLDNSVIDNDSRIMFMIFDLQNNAIGHIGFSAFNYTEKSAEIDSVVRGVKHCLPGLMHFVVKTIIDWGYKTLGLKSICLKVFKDNDHAIKFYRACGFCENGLISLVKIHLSDEEKWEIDETVSIDCAEKLYQKMIYKGWQ